MAASFLYLSIHFLVCFLFFCLVQRPVFMVYNGIGGLCVATRHGYRSDLIAAAYLTALPMLVLWVHAHTGFAGLGVALGVAEGVVCLLMNLVAVADAALYRFWHFKIDASVLQYLSHPQAAFASVSAGYLTVGFGAVLLLAAAMWALLRALCGVCGVWEPDGPWPWWMHLPALLCFVAFAAVLFAFIRGIASRPNNPSLVCFSTEPALNHSALNPLYNIVYSLGVKDVFAREFRYTDADTADRAGAALYPVEGTPQRQLLRTRRPNILLVIWESLSGNYAGCIGGRPGVTPNLDALAAGGVLFSQVHSGSFRTDRALPCVIGGIPGQPTASIIRYTRKLAALPSWVRTLREQGYRTAAYQGGDMSVMHMSDYFLASGHDRLVQLSDLPADAPRCRWGVHDHYMARVVADDIQREDPGSGPWLKTWLTLSSHEPFKVPFSKFDHPISNAFAYTDDSIGYLARRLKEDGRWDDTLVVIVGDHGLNNDDSPVPRIDYPHIPLVLTGGAVATPAVIDTLMSQTDLAATLLGQLGLDHREFVFSRDVLADTYTQPFAFHSYVNGFVMRDATGVTDYDNTLPGAVSGADPAREERGRTVQQYLYQYLNSI